jgi:amidohydrolase
MRMSQWPHRPPSSADLPVERLLAEAGDDLVALRRHFHAQPELAFQEVQTAATIAERLTDLGLEVRERVGKTGVVARLFGTGVGPVVALRADIDGLPIQEQSEAPYASRNSGVMHACGHDGHIAILLTVAKVLSGLRSGFPGEVRFIFQPAEEVAGGAPAMLADGAFHDPRPEACFGLHLWNNLPAGQIGVRAGPLFAHTDEFGIVVNGTGGHGAMPHQTVDPIVVAAHLVTALQTMVSRETSPLAPAVVTVGSIHGGTAFNIVPPQVELRGTIRTFTDELQAQMKSRLEDLTRGVTSGMRADYEFWYRSACPAVVNDDEATAFALAVAQQVFDPRQVVEPQQTMGGDDMSYFLAEAPGTYFLVGAANPARGIDAPHHHPRFDLDESALPVGARLLTEVALAKLRS